MNVNDRDAVAILEQLVGKLKAQALELDGSASAFDNGQQYAYYDVLSFLRDQAEVMDIPAAELGLDFDIDALLKTRRAA